jgi:hypothetical protein
MKRPRVWLVAISMTVFGAALVGACGSSGNSGTGGGGKDQGSTSASSPTTGTAGGVGIDINPGTGQSLRIEPQNAVLDVSGSPKSLPLVAKLSDGSVASAVTWSLDDVVVGAMAGDGNFVSQGFVAGKATVTAQSGALSASTTVTVRVNIVDNPGNVSTADQGALEAGGQSDANFRWLYPYDKTIFPRGIAAPSLQFGGTKADATLIHIKVGDFEYKGFFGPSTPARAALPEAVWKAMTLSAGATDTVTVQATKLSAGFATGPASEAWRIAQGSLKGVIYYNTYQSKLASTGAVMRIRPGQNAEVLLGGCTVCHAVSAKGNVLVAGVDWGSGNPLDSASFDLTADGSAAPRAKDADGRKFAFAAPTPDGALMLTNGVPASGSPIRGLEGDFPTKLLDTKTGLAVTAPSLTALVKYALTPVFSPDGKRVAFNHFDTGAGKTLAVMDFDGSQSPPLFSNLTDVVSVPSGVAGWPSFTSDGGGVVYHEGEHFDTALYGGGASYGNVRFVDVASKATSALGLLNGYDAGKFYLPYGEAEEGNLDYEPSVLPVPVGGYYWVLFTSRRAFGNTIAPGGTVPGGDNKWGSLQNGAEVPSPRKKLWLAAIDLDFQGKADPSHPAFYLPGQELESGNMRGFAALEPCKGDGASCESGAECCGGFCRQVDGGDGGAPSLQCVPPPAGGCANVDETCSTAADCCNASSGTLCINERCTEPTPK